MYFSSYNTFVQAKIKYNGTRDNQTYIYIYIYNMGISTQKDLSLRNVCIYNLPGIRYFQMLCATRKLNRHTTCVDISL